jgi:NitT/TauT family transport system ATP-binding protein
MNKILELKNISKKYYTLKGEIEAINNISLDIFENDFIALIGPSGCGKSTLLSILNKQEEKSSGNIYYYDKSIGYMLQEDCLFDWLNILDNCLLGLKIKKILTKENKDYVYYLLEKYGLKDFMYQYPKSLSGGMRQRVALIRTLALKPDILLMDEPFSALDSQTRINISNDVYKILKQENKTLILVTHSISEALLMCNRIIILSNRPSTIKKEYNIQYKTDNLIEKKYTEEFNNYYNLISKDMNYE